MDPLTAHICQDAFLGAGDMREAYKRLSTIPTSTNADTFLIRSHVAYWSGRKTAEAITIKPSRGRSYRIRDANGKTLKIVGIADHYDHRNGVTGWL